MEALTRLVTDSLARHGFDRPSDPRRLHWSRWFRCDSPHSLLFVPSKPGIFAFAEEIMDLGHVGDVLARHLRSDGVRGTGHDFSRAVQVCNKSHRLQPLRPLAACSPSSNSPKTTTWPSSSTACSRAVNPMRARLASGRCFVRFVVIEDQAQRRSICSALNQWMLSSAEKATGIGSDFSTSLELSHE